MYSAVRVLLPKHFSYQDYAFARLIIQILWHLIFWTFPVNKYRILSGFRNVFHNIFPSTLGGNFEVYQKYLGDYSNLDFAFFIKKKKKKNPTPFIKGIFHFHATLFYLLNKWGQVLSSHYSPAGRSYLTFLQAVVHPQRKQYWATLLHFVKEKLLRGGGKKARFCRRCCAWGLPSGAARDHYCPGAAAFSTRAGWHLPWSWHRTGWQRLRPCYFCNHLRWQEALGH